MEITTFINRITIACKEKGLTRTEWARDFGISEATVRNWIRNGNFPSVEIVNRIASYFGVSMEFLLGIDEPKIDDIDFLILTKLKKLTPEQKKLVIAVEDSLFKEQEKRP